MEAMETICFQLVRELMQFEEPVPEFQTRFPNKLESILEIPKQDFYPTIFEKAACYFYFIIKNHPMLNGNKRLAIVTTYVFMRLNGYILGVPWKEMYEFAVKLALETKSHEREFKEVVNFVKKYSKKRPLPL